MNDGNNHRRHKARELAKLAAILADHLTDPYEARAKIAIDRVQGRLRFAMVENARGTFRGVIAVEDFVRTTQDAVSLWFREAFIAGLEECGVDPAEMTPEDESTILNQTVPSLFALQGFGGAFAAGEIVSERQAVARALTYVSSARNLYALGQASGCSNRMMRWDLGQTEEHCRDCLGYAGQVHRMSTWRRRGALPQARVLSCRGFHCDCRLVETRERARGRIRDPENLGVLIPF